MREQGITASSGGRPPTGPTVRDGTVYLGSSRGILACDATSGAIEWGATLDEHVVSKESGPTWRTDWATPAVTADRAFTFDMNDGYGTTREVYAVDRTTGEQDWTAELDLGDGWSLQGHVVAGDGRVFVSALDPHTSLAGETEEGWSGSERLFALDAATGAVDWSWDLTGKTLTPPALADGTLYLGEWYPDADTGRLHAVDVADGSVDWTYKTGVSAVRAVTVAANTIYIAAGEGVAAIDPVEGSRRWRVPTDAILSAPIVVGDRLYLHTNPGHNWDSRVIAMRASSG
jgi:outer membrane protein assembly factor BamB